MKVREALGGRVGRDVFMYSLTLDPLRDTPERLKAYAEAHGVGPGWLFLTGRPEEIEVLRRKLGFYQSAPAEDADKTQHLGVILIGNEKLDRWCATPGLSNPEEIAKAVGWMDPIRARAAPGLSRR